MITNQTNWILFAAILFHDLVVELFLGYEARKELLGGQELLATATHGAERWRLCHLFGLLKTAASLGARRLKLAPSYLVTMHILTRFFVSGTTSLFVLFPFHQLLFGNATVSDANLSSDTKKILYSTLLDHIKYMHQPQVVRLGTTSLRAPR